MDALHVRNKLHRDHLCLIWDADRCPRSADAAERALAHQYRAAIKDPAQSLAMQEWECVVGDGISHCPWDE